MLSTFQTRIDPSGRITLPPEILRALHLEPGMMLSIQKNKKKITLEPIFAEEPMLIEKEGVLVLHAKLTEDISNIVESVRNNRTTELIENQQIEILSQNDIRGGATYDALIAHAARKVNADKLFTFNSKHFIRAYPSIANIVAEPT